MNTPQTLQDAITYFSDPERAFVYMVNWRWPDRHVTCPRCGHDKHSFIKTRWMWFCKGCKKQFTAKVGTIFEDSPIPFTKWLPAMWLIANCKNGISSHELARDLGVTQKTAWFMLHRLRLALQSDTGAMLGGNGSPVEVDETYYSPNLRKMHNDRRGRAKKSGRAIVMGLLERDGHVRASVIPSTERKPLHANIKKHVAAGATVYTDNWAPYFLMGDEYLHEVVVHSEYYVRGQVHTNGIENFWSLLKRGLRGTYVSVEPFHLDRYLDEQVFRFNTRKDGDRKITDAERFNIALSQVAGKRLTFAEVTGKTGSAAQA
jgi:transposase-like protein